MRRASIVGLVLVLAAGHAAAQVPDGVYSGTTTQGQALSVTVSAGTITSYTVGWTGLCSSSGSITATTSCPITGGSFSCGSSSSCIPGAATASISGSFDGLHVRGSASVRFSAAPPVSCCQLASNIPWIANHSSWLFEEGFETGSFGSWSLVSGGPLLVFWLRNPVWSNGGSDTLSARIDGTPVFTLAEGVPGWQAPYRKVLIDLAAYAGGSHDLELAATSSADTTRADSYLDDVAITCPGGVPNPVADPSFEAGTPNPSWDEASTNFGTPLCSPGSCGATGARSGTWWAWYGGTSNVENASLAQNAIAVPTCP
jgi:hypothetical protein